MDQSVVEGNEAAEISRAVESYLDVLASTKVPADGGDARFLKLLQKLFEAAAQRSADSHAVRENKAALAALAIAAGDSRVAILAGIGPQKERARQIDRAIGRVSLRGRNDWARHFSVSAGLTALASPRISSAAGLLKELSDADGGSGFSFADLMADRAGTRFAVAATGSETAAREFQRRIRAGVQVDQIFPVADNLPEGLQFAEFDDRYGGVGGKGYQRLSQEINRRLARCAFLQQASPSRED